jgi:hypothetical protein
MKTHLRFLEILEHRPRLDHGSLARRFGGSWAEFIQRGWIYRDGYLTHIDVPFLDGEEDVEVEVDELAGRYYYASPQRRSLRVTRHLSEITLYRIALERWLDDLAEVVGIRPPYRSNPALKLDAHLWHLGDIRISSTNHVSPIFLGRRLDGAPQAHLAAMLSDPIWPGRGMVLVHQSTGIRLPGDHLLRGLHELACVDADTAFDHPALERLLSGNSPVEGKAVEQFIKGNWVKLPHFDVPRELAPAQLRIIKLMWGKEARPAPEMSWAEVNLAANTGYCSFDDAFASPGVREEFIERVRRGCYRLRRKP